MSEDRLMDDLALVIPLRKAWSESARMAAAEARKAAALARETGKGVSRPSPRSLAVPGKARRAAAESRRQAQSGYKKDRGNRLEDKISRAARTAASLTLKARQMNAIADKYRGKDAVREAQFRAGASRANHFAELNLNGVRQFTRELRDWRQFTREQGALGVDRDRQDQVRLREVGA